MFGNLLLYFVAVCGVAYNTVVPVMNGHPRDKAKVSVHCRWPPIRGTLTLKGVGRGIDSVAVQGRCLAICYCILLLHLSLMFIVI